MLAVHPVTGVHAEALVDKLWENPPNDVGAAAAQKRYTCAPNCVAWYPSWSPTRYPPARFRPRRLFHWMSRWSPATSTSSGTVEMRRQARWRRCDRRAGGGRQSLLGRLARRTGCTLMLGV